MSLRLIAYNTSRIGLILITSVSDNKEIRDAAVEAEQALSEFNIETYMRMDGTLIIPLDNLQF